MKDACKLFEFKGNIYEKLIDTMEKNNLIPKKLGLVP